MSARRAGSGAFLAALLAALVAVPPGRAQIASPDALADTLRRSLDEDLLAHWYPRAIDSVHGGSLSDFAHDWAPAGPQDKFIVTQARPDGTPYRDGYDDETPPKGQNSTIHLLEAFTTLYQVAPDTPGLRDRLAELLVLTRDTMTTDRGSLRLFFARDWPPISYRDSSRAVREAHYALDHVSFGHDVETAFLMLEAAEALGRDPAPTLSVGTRMVDHALRHGRDRTTGGLYDGGLVVGPDSVRVVRRTKAWWAQAEALHTFALWAQRRPDAAPDYAAKARATWRYIDRFLIDPEHGGWYRSGLDTAPDACTAPKGSIWKGTYHTARALLRTAVLLEGS